MARKKQVAKAVKVAMTDDNIRAAVKSQLTAKPMPEKRQTARVRIAGGGAKVLSKLKFPFQSEAMGVNPEQCEAAEAAARANGIPTEFDRTTGAAIITSEAHMQKLGKSVGMKTGKDGWETASTGRQEQRNREERRRIMREMAGYPEGMEPIPMARPLPNE